MALGAQRLDDRQTVESGQHAVDDDDIEWLAGSEKQSVPAVGRVLDVEAGLPEPLDQIGRGLFIVFDQEDTHEGRGLTNRNVPFMLRKGPSLQNTPIVLA